MLRLVNLFKKYKELIMYAFFGVCTTAINILIYYLLFNSFGLSNVISNIIAWFFSCLFAFITNKLFVFSSKSVHFKILLYELLSFYLARLFTGFLDVGFMYLMVDVLNLPNIIMKVVSNVIVIILNYVFSKIFIFKKKNKIKIAKTRQKGIEDKFYDWWVEKKTAIKKFRKNLNFNKRFILYSSIIFIVLTAIFFIQLLPYSVNGRWLDYPLFVPGDNERFHDMRILIYNSTVYSPYFNGCDPSQPPFAYIFARIIYLLICSFGIKFDPQNFLNDQLTNDFLPFKIVVWVYSILIAILFIILLVKLLKKFKFSNAFYCSSILIFVAFSGPLIFCLERGNHLIVCLVLLLTYFLLIDSKKVFNKIVGICCISLAISLKTAFIILLIYPLTKKKYFDSLCILITTAAIYLISFAILGGPFIESIKKYIELTKSYSEFTSLYDNVSISALIQNICYGNLDFALLYKASRAISIIFAIISIILCLPQKDDWKKLSLLSCTMVLLPATSYVYYVMLFIIPFVYLVSKKKHNYCDIMYIALFVFILTPIQFGTFKQTTTSVLIRSIAITLLNISLIVDTSINIVRNRKLSEVCNKNN